MSKLLRLRSDASSVHTTVWRDHTCSAGSRGSWCDKCSISLRLLHLFYLGWVVHINSYEEVRFCAEAELALNIEHSFLIYSRLHSFETILGLIDDIGALFLVLVFHQAYILLWKPRIFGTLSCCPVPRDSYLPVLLPGSYSIGRNTFIRAHIRGGCKVDLRPHSEALGRGDDSYDSMLRGMPCADPTDLCTNQLASARSPAWPYYQHRISASAVWRARVLPIFLLSGQVSFTSTCRTFFVMIAKYSPMDLHRQSNPLS